MDCNNRRTYKTYIEAGILLLIGVIIGITLVYLYIALSGTVEKVDKIYTILDPDRVNVELNVMK